MRIRGRASAVVLTSAAVAIAIVAAREPLHLATMHGRTLRAALETAMVLSGAVAAFLAYRPFEPLRQRRDLLLAAAIIGLTVLELGAYGLLAISGRGSSTHSIAIGLIAGCAAGLTAGFCLLIAGGVARERAARRNIAAKAALAERRRVARDLHDGLAQDLAFIAANGARIASELGEDHQIVVAARRALAISRGTIDELSSGQETGAHDALRSVADELAARFSIRIDLDVPAADELPPASRDDAVRIVREAIANAARHGHAEHVVVSLRRTARGLVLRVADDGCGFAVEQRDEGFGLRSSRERAAAIGGRLSLRESNRGGIELQVTVP